MAGLVEKIEINCDMGEGFGRWKMVSHIDAVIANPFIGNLEAC